VLRECQDEVHPRALFHGGVRRKSDKLSPTAASAQYSTMAPELGMSLGHE
jgi:hypothetical protein